MIRPAFRLAVVALASLTLACFYYQLSDLDRLKEVLLPTPSQQAEASPEPNVEDEILESTTKETQEWSVATTSTISSRASEQTGNVPSHKVTSPGMMLASSTKILEGTASTSTINAAKAINDKAVVMGAFSTDNVTWATTKLIGWDAYIYIVDNTTMPLHTERNKGREGNAYLTFIIENYASLPSTVAFVHSHEDGWPEAWHTDARQNSNVHSLNMLRTNFVQKKGYANLRCKEEPGCPDAIRPFREPKLESNKPEIAFAEAWREIFDDDNVPDVIGVACCAQFAVSKQQILKRSREEYIRMHQWLMNTELDDETSGRVFEYLWHVIFGQEPVHCPDMMRCYFDVYGIISI